MESFGRGRPDSSSEAEPVYEPSDLAPYLAFSTIVDADHAAVAERARQLADGDDNGEFGVLRRCYEWVSNEVAHSMDCAAETVPCTASEVLAAGHGLCYAKSHLLAALLRANGIPTGFDYQRLGDDRGGYALHGLNTVYLSEHSVWLRLDPRGKADGAVRLPAPKNRLLFSAAGPGELDYRLNLPEPVPEVVRLLRGAEVLGPALDKLPQSVLMG